MRRDVLIYAVALLISVVGHVGLFEGLGAAARQAPVKPQRVLEVAVVKTPPPPPPKVEEPPKPPPPKPRDLTKVKLPPPNTPPPPNTEEKVAAKEPPKPVFGISMQSVVGPGTNSGFAVRVGNTLMKEPEKERTRPEDVRAYGPVPLHQVNKIPTRIGECQPPADKRPRGVEGKVRLEVLITATGEVGDVRVVSGISPEVDALVVATIRGCRFSPAEVGGQPVATRINYTYTWVSED
jgi:protein TonB